MQGRSALIDAAFAFVVCSSVGAFVDDYRIVARGGVHARLALTGPLVHAIVAGGDGRVTVGDGLQAIALRVGREGAVWARQDSPSVVVSLALVLRDTVPPTSTPTSPGTPPDA